MSVNSQAPGVAGPQMPAPVYQVLERTRLRATGRTTPDLNVELILQIKVTFSERVVVTQAALVDSGATILLLHRGSFFLQECWNQRASHCLCPQLRQEEWKGANMGHGQMYLCQFAVNLVASGYSAHEFSFTVLKYLMS